MEIIRNVEELNATCKHLKELQAQQKALAEAMEEVKSLVKAYMDTQSTDRISTEDYNVIWSMVDRKDVDRKKLEEDGLLEKYLKHSDYPQLRVNAKRK